MAEYRLAPAAERDLEKVWTYTVQHWGLGQANRYIDIISTAFRNWRKSRKQLQHVITSELGTVGIVSDDI
ncbi:type II toxin-antitoxin system RelE/ParE family toxin [Pseudomonas sp. FP198]|uniref:type II toxin-antitoxin system RelE/ParE family toxin n=1 Tax=Pseudomonas sp. FP198 TaxID=2954084 RepID=UPI0035209A94